MRSGATAFVRLVTILVMALGLGAMTGVSAVAQASTTDITCQVIKSDAQGVSTGEIDQSSTCTVTVAEDGRTCTLSINGIPVSEGDDVTTVNNVCRESFLQRGDCSVGVLLSDGAIIQFTASPLPPGCDVETDTDTEDTDTDTSDDGEADEEEVADEGAVGVETLPSTGQNPASEQGNSTSAVVLLGAMSVLMLAAAAALRQGRQA